MGVLTALGLTLAGIGLMPADKPDAVAAEKAKLKGTWRVESVTLGGKPVDPNGLQRRFAYLPWVIDDDSVSFLEADGAILDGKPSQYRIDPTVSPKRFDLLTDESARLMDGPGLYKLDGDTLTVLTAREGARPTSFDDAKLPGVRVSVLKRMKPEAAEKAKLQGTWRVKSLKRGGQEVDFNDPNRAADARRWQFTEAGINYLDVTDNGMRQAIPYQLDPGASPKRIDFVTDSRPDAPYLAGIYKLDGDTLTVARAATPTKYGEVAGSRPTDFNNSAADVTVWSLERITRAQWLEQFKLDGTWVIDRVAYDGDEARGALFFNSGTIQFYSGQVRSDIATSHYTVDVSVTPYRIDLSERLAGAQDFTIWNTPSPGIYKIENDILTWHFAAPDGKGKTTGRPTDFTPSKPGSRHVLAVLRRPKPPAKPAAEVAPTPPAPVASADAFTGSVKVNGRAATSGRVAVYFGRGQFAGSLLVNGQFNIVGVPAGTHRVVVEGEVDGVRETTTASVEFPGAAREFDLK